MVLLMTFVSVDEVKLIKVVKLTTVVSFYVIGAQVPIILWRKTNTIKVSKTLL